MTYAIVEVFKTLQGEGLYAGRSAVFVRFAGCNLWSGTDETRERDATRNAVHCPRWCDTDFLKRDAVDLSTLCRMIAVCGPADLVVFTGGEPLLQLDESLVRACNVGGYITCIETNGTAEPKSGVLEALQHVCVSPKVPVHRMAFLDVYRETAREGTAELKVVFPAYDPMHYEAIRSEFTHAFVSPEAATSARGVSVVQRSVEQLAAEFCMSHPGWGLSLQTHKHLELP